jgi:hypothetical protein
VKARVKAEGRPAALVLSGDFDASGMDISRSFVEMTSSWKKVHRIGLDEGLITRYGLPVRRAARPVPAGDRPVLGRRRFPGGAGVGEAAPGGSAAPRRGPLTSGAVT